MSTENENTSPLIFDQPRLRALLTVLPYFEFMGATEIRARCLGFEAPEVINGTIEAHRPDLTLRQGNKLRTPLFMDIVMDPGNPDPNRVTLFGSAAKSFEAELGFVVPASVPKGEKLLRAKLASVGITPQVVLVI